MSDRIRYFIHCHKKDLEKRIVFDEIRNLLEECNLLSSSKIADITSKKLNFIDELSEMDSDEFPLFINVLKKVGYDVEAEWLDQSVFTNSEEKLYYKMNSSPLGFCIIINNVEFINNNAEYLEKRMASDKDIQDISNMFLKIGYKVFQHRNLSAEQMQNELQLFSQLPDLANVDSCIVYISTHGQEFGRKDWLFGADCNLIQKESIYDIFSSEKCVYLQNKPKIFFFQACRKIPNDHFKTGVLLNINENNETIFMVDGCLKVLGYSIRMSKLEKSVECLNYKENEKREAKLSDFIVIHSALPEKASEESLNISSPFCQTLVNVFSSEYRKLDLDTMLVLVSRAIDSQLQDSYYNHLIHVEKFAAFGLVHFFKMRTRPASSTPVSAGPEPFNNRSFIKDFNTLITIRDGTNSDLAE